MLQHRISSIAFTIAPHRVHRGINNVFVESYMSNQCVVQSKSSLEFKLGYPHSQIEPISLSCYSRLVPGMESWGGDGGTAMGRLFN